MMRRTIRHIITILACLGLPVLTWSFDIGGAVDNTTAGNNLFSGGFNIAQSDKLSLWLSHNFDENMSLSAKGNFKFALTNGLLTSFNPALGKDIKLTGDLDSLVWFLNLPNAFGDKTRLKLWVGRTSFADFSSEIINHKLDGASAELAFPGLSWKFGLGTSALLFKHSSGLFAGSGDMLDMATTADWAKPETVFVAPKLVLVNTISIPQLFWGQSLDIGLVGQLDLRATQALPNATVVIATDRVPVDSAYLGAGLNGKIVGPLYWNLYSWCEMGYTLANINNVYTPTFIISNMDSVRLTAYLTEVLGSVVDLGGKVGLGDSTASGAFADTNTDTLGTMFTPVSFRGVANIFNPQMTNLIQADLGYSFMPFAKAAPFISDFQVAVRGFSFMRLFVNAPTSETLIANTAEFYLGTEIDLNITWRPISDLGLTLSSGAFLPNPLALKDSASGIGRLTEYKTSLQLSLSL